MKYLIIIFLLIGCADINKDYKHTIDSIIIERYKSTGLDDRITIYELEGHKYARGYNTSLIHLESCKCKLK